MQVPGNVFVKEPPELRKPAAADGELPWTAEEWRSSPEYTGLSANYTHTYLNGKVEKVVADIEEVRDDAQANATRKPKIIVFSNFDKTFQLLKKALLDTQVHFSCAA